MKLIANSLITIGSDAYKPGEVLPQLDPAMEKHFLSAGFAVLAPGEPDDEPDILDGLTIIPNEGQPASGASTLTGHIDEGELKTMTLAALKRLAEDMGIDTDDVKRKSDLVATIAAMEVEASLSEAEGDENGHDV